MADTQRIRKVAQRIADTRRHGKQVCVVVSAMGTTTNELLAKITAIRETRSDAEAVVYLRGDKDVCYTDMMKLLGYIRQAGFKANIVIVPEQGS